MRPDLAFGMSVASQVGSDKRSVDMRKLLKLVERAKENPLVVRMERLRGKVRIETYKDASFGSVKDERSQVGFVVGIKDEWEGRCLIFWKSRKG